MVVQVYRNFFIRIQCSVHLYSRSCGKGVGADKETGCHAFVCGGNKQYHWYVLRVHVVFGVKLLALPVVALIRRMSGNGCNVKFKSFVVSKSLF